MLYYDVMETKNKKRKDIAMNKGTKVFISGTLLSLTLFVANLVVFQNLLQGPVFGKSNIKNQMGSKMSHPIITTNAAISKERFEEFKKREHIRTIVYNNFKGIPFIERGKLFEVIYEQSQKMGIDPYLTLSIIATESSFRKNVISWAGAYGLMQIKVITAQEVAEELGIVWEGKETLFDPVVNITLGLRYLANMMKRFGNMSDALTAYNYGPQYVVSCLRNDRELPDKYVKKIEKNLSRYGLNAAGLIYKENKV